MQQKKSRGNKASTSVAELSGLSPPDNAQDGDAASASRLDFFSGDFNRIDELDDNVGNYREFASLDGVVTADMRYHEKRKKNTNIPGDDPGKKEDIATRECRREEGSEQRLPQPLIIVSGGNLLIVAPDLSPALNCGRQLQQRGINCTLCVTGQSRNEAAFSSIDGFVVIEAGSVVIDGCFGGFTAKLAATEVGQTDMTVLPEQASGRSPDSFDLILDLHSTPSYCGPLLPVGYFAPGQGQEEVDEAIRELAEMRGRFHKAQLTVFRNNRCLNGRSRFLECQRCLDICPFTAISVALPKKKIAIDQYRCQGCGWCGLVCPVEAIELQQPRRETLLAEMVDHLPLATTVGMVAPELFLYDKSLESSELSGTIADYAGHPLLLAVDEIGRIGLESLFIALAYGAASVTLVYNSTLPLAMREVLEGQVRLGRDILEGLQIPGGCLSLLPYPGKDAEFDLEPSRQHSSLAEVAVQEIPPPNLTLMADRRELICQAVGYLTEKYGLSQVPIALSPGAPFGTITVSSACSFCMVCVGSCPAGALATDGQLPRLSIVESRCHQCSLCATVCPEDAINMIPRLLVDFGRAATPAVLCEEEPFICIECGRPFASKKMIARMQEKLAGHWMYRTGRQVRRLQMCHSCRTHDALVAGDL